jgi:hypothetical protein
MTRARRGDWRAQGRVPFWNGARGDGGTQGCAAERGNDKHRAQCEADGKRDPGAYFS